MSRKQTSILGGFLLTFGFLLLPSLVRAETTLYSVFFEAQALAKGTYVQYEDIAMGIPAGIFAESLFVKIKKPDQKNIPPAPKNTVLVSEVYIYDIRMKQPRVLKKPVRVTLNVKTDSSANKRLYFFDRNVAQWVPMQSQFDVKEERIHSALPFPYSLVAIFADAPPSSGKPVLREGAAWSTYDSDAFIVIDRSTQEVLYEKQSRAVRPMASLTKLMTALVALKHGINFKQVATYDSSCDRVGSRLYVQAGETLYLRDLWYTMLGGSANNATVCLVLALGFDEQTFVQKMNAEASRLGLVNTHFVDATGLSENNVTTAAEFVVIANEALKYFDVLQATTIPAYRFTTLNRGVPHTIRNTNRFLFDLEYRITGAKTGYTDEALYTQMLAAKDKQGHEIIVVLLGNPAWQDRYDEAKQLVRETFANYVW